MDTRNGLLRNLRGVLDLLENIPSDEVAHGWDMPRIRNWHAVFSKLRDAVQDGVPLCIDYDGVVYVRGLDMDGIHSGRIFDAAIDIGDELRDLCRQEAGEGEGN